jgi:hypothetical protein
VNERIHLEVTTRSDAEALQQELDQFDSDVVRDGEGWVVSLRPTRETAPELLNLFEAIGRWLEAREQASLRARFGERSFTIMRPSDARPGDSAEFLLERVIQLQNALDSRVSIEQAKGVLAERLKIDVDEAFDVLRGAARRAGSRLQDLAREVVGSAELPEIVKEFLQRRTTDRAPAANQEGGEPAESLDDESQRVL